MKPKYLGYLLLLCAPLALLSGSQTIHGQSIVSSSLHDNTSDSQSSNTDPGSVSLSEEVIEYKGVHPEFWAGGGSVFDSKLEDPTNIENGYSQDETVIDVTKGSHDGYVTDVTKGSHDKHVSDVIKGSHDYNEDADNIGKPEELSYVFELGPGQYLPPKPEGRLTISVPSVTTPYPSVTSVPPKRVRVVASQGEIRDENQLQVIERPQVFISPGPSRPPLTYTGAVASKVPSTKPSRKVHQANPTQPSPKASKTLRNDRVAIFEQNTGMTAEQRDLFFAYIRAVAQEARRVYGNDQNKVNHAIANAIASPSYGDQKLQKLTNDFFDIPIGQGYDEAKQMLEKIHLEQTYLIDFPHLAAPLATSEKSVWWKEVLKDLAGLSLLAKSEDNFFQLNSLTGDLLSDIDDKDKRTDLDAIILKYHPKFKDLPLDQRLERYYHQKDLDYYRRLYYRDLLKAQADKGVTPTEQEILNIAYATLSLGG